MLAHLTWGSVPASTRSCHCDGGSTDGVHAYPDAPRPPEIPAWSGRKSGARSPRGLRARDRGARSLEQGVVDGGTPRLVRQQEPPAVSSSAAAHPTAGSTSSPTKRRPLRARRQRRGPDAAAPVQGGHRDVAMPVDAAPYDGHASSTSVSTTDAPRSAAARPAAPRRRSPARRRLPRNSSGRRCA